MSWQYRVSKQILRSGKVEYAIREFAQDGKTWAEGEIAPSANSVDDLRWVLTKMLKALDKEPIEIGKY